MLKFLLASVLAVGILAAPSGTVLTGPFETVDTTVTGAAYRLQAYGPNLPTSSVQPWTVTNTNNTVAAASNNSRPALAITDGNTGATDKTTYFIQAASIIPQANKRIRIRGSFLESTTTPDWMFGIGVVGTDPIGTEPTNYVAIRKLSAESVFSIRSRKASGTAQTLALNTAALTVNTWYEFEIFIIQNTGSAAGTAHVEVYFGPSTGGTNLPQVASVDLANNFPDTVAMAPFFEERAGATDSNVHAVGFVSYEVEL